MSVSQFGIAVASIAQVLAQDGGKKIPRKRQLIAKRDEQLAPEPR